jgi:hypothetical protein
MSLPERGWTGYGAQGHPYAKPANQRCADYTLADTHLTRAHKGLALMAEIPPRSRYDVASEVTAFLALVAITEGE